MALRLGVRAASSMAYAVEDDLETRGRRERRRATRASRRIAFGRQRLAAESIEEELAPGVGGDGEEGGLEIVFGHAGVAEHHQRALAEPLHPGAVGDARDVGEESWISCGRAADVVQEGCETRVPG